MSPSPSKMTRDLVLFVVGLALSVIVVVVTLVTTNEYPALLLFLAGMMGVPTALRYDEQRRDRRNGDGP